MLRTKANVFLELNRVNRQLALQAEQLRRVLIADQASAEARNAERLTEIAAKPAQIEEMLRRGGGATGPSLADRVAELEDTVRALQPPPPFSSHPPGALGRSPRSTPPLRGLGRSPSYGKGRVGGINRARRSEAAPQGPTPRR